MLAVTRSGAVLGVEGCLVDVEVDVSGGLPAVVVVGLGDAAIQESRDRVRAALRNAGYDFPYERVTINLAPADLRKVGPLYDLPIAVGILAASAQLPSSHLGRFLLMGELSLDGHLRPVTGVLPIALEAQRAGVEAIALPLANAREASLVEGLTVYGVASLQDVCALLADPASREPFRHEGARLLDAADPGAADFSEVKGQEQARRALEVSAAGGHNAMLVGAPGSGKTMLARRLPGILPPLSREECLEVSKIYSTAGLLTGDLPLVTRRPFRSPHHSISPAGLVGGAANARPGEISLSHLGVLFLDEFNEFSRSVLEVMRQPLEDRKVTISRARVSLTYPAAFTLVAASNPCPCGYRGDALKPCSCSELQAERYWSRLSGPLLDRIDLQIAVPRLPEDDLLSHRAAESSERIRERVVAARERQAWRFRSIPGVYSNSAMSARLIRDHCRLDEVGEALLRRAISQLSLSARSYDRVLKVSRTIADLAGSEAIQAAHVAEAIQYRMLDRGKA
ncbi:Competence protein ComM [compost metagenome]